MQISGQGLIFEIITSLESSPEAIGKYRKVVYLALAPLITLAHDHAWHIRAIKPRIDKKNPSAPQVLFVHRTFMFQPQYRHRMQEKEAFFPLFLLKRRKLIAFSKEHWDSENRRKI